MNILVMNVVRFKIGLFKARAMANVTIAPNRNNFRIHIP